MIRLELVSRKHVLCSGHCHMSDSVPINGRIWLRKFFGGPPPVSGGACLCFDNDDIVGFFRFTIERNILQAYGTWVFPSWRKSGLGIKMWEFVLRKKKHVSRVIVDTVTRGGLRMIKRLASRNHRLAWRAEHWDPRSGYEYFHVSCYNVLAKTRRPSGSWAQMSRFVSAPGPMDAVSKALLARKDGGYPFMGCEIAAIDQSGFKSVFVLDSDTGRLEKMTL